MTSRQTRATVGFAALAAIIWLVVGTAAQAQVEQSHLRIDGMT